MRLKFVKMKRKPLNKRFLSAVLGFSFALAPVPYLLSCASAPVYAQSDVTERFVTALEDEVDYLYSVYFQSNFDPFSPSERRLYALLQAYLGVVKNDAISELPSEFYYGMYYLTGSSDAHSVTVITGNSVLAVADDFECYMVWRDYYGNDVEPPEYTVTPFTSTAPYINTYGNKYTFTTGSAFVDRKYCILRSNYFTVSKSVGHDVTDALLAVYSNNTGIPTINSSTDFTQSSGAIMGKPSVASFPVGSFSPASPWEYYNNVLVPTINSELPVDVQIDPIDAPYDPIYPSEYVTGIPKEWTVENPQLPTAADLEFEHYEEDLTGFHPIQEIKETVDIIKAMDFWWWLTEKTLDCLNLKIFYVIFLTVGVLIFIVWIIGQ